jgi:putative FmdB family regulatory protein
MPTYEYHCTACGKEWEQFQSIKAAPERTCPACGKRTAQRKIGMGAAILVGGRTAEPPAESRPAPDAPQKESTMTAKKTGDGDTTPPATAKKASATEAATPAAPKEAEPAPASKATHPAREGRGVGNMLDALARARRMQEERSHNRGPGSNAGHGKGFGGGRAKGGRPSAPRRAQGK